MNILDMQKRHPVDRFCQKLIDDQERRNRFYWALPFGSGHSPEGGAAKASPAKPSVPNAERGK